MLHKSPSKSAGTDVLSQNYALGKQSSIIPLTFSDLSPAVHLLERIGYGGDCWEVRCDLLSSSKDPLGTTNLPNSAFVAEQIDLLQRYSKLPVLFTIRTVSQGGKFPDHGDKEALELMLLAIEKGCEYIDVEIEWPSSLIQIISKRKKNTKIVGSYHSWTGNVRWTSQVLKEKYTFADSFGDIVKLSILSQDLYDCFELGLFVRDHNSRSTKPLLAVGMGANGQLSRITSPISLVTHNLIPFPSAPGQLTMCEVHQARHLMGQLPKKEYYGLDNTQCREVIFQAGFKEIGFPHRYHVEESDVTETRLETLMAKPTFGGASFCPSANLSDILDETSNLAKASGMIDTIAELTNKDGLKFRFGENTQCIAYQRCLQRGSKSNSGHAVIVILASGSTSSAASAALKSLCLQGAIVSSLKDYGTLKDVGVGLLIQSSVAENFVLEDIPAGWKVITWEELLLEQIYAQFSLWTGRPAPKTVISSELRK